jgi:hypothetical protein
MRIDLSSNRDQEGKDKTLRVGRFAMESAVHVSRRAFYSESLNIDEQGNQTIRFETQ